MMLKIAKILTAIAIMLSIGHIQAYNMTTSSTFVNDDCGFWLASDGKYYTMNSNCKKTCPLPNGCNIDTIYYFTRFEGSEFLSTKQLPGMRCSLTSKRPKIDFSNSIKWVSNGRCMLMEVILCHVRIQITNKI